MSIEAVVTPGQTPASPVTTTTEVTAAPVETTKPVGGLEGNGQVATPVTPDAAPVVPETVPEKPVVPERYELKLSEGSALDPAHVEQVQAYAKSKGMTQAQAQEVLVREEGIAKGFFDAQKTRVDQAIEGWKQTSLKDAEFGGAKFGESVELAKRAMTKFGGDTFSKLLDESGYGNHPEVIRVFTRIGKAMAEDRMTAPGNAGGGTVALEDRFYKPKQK